MCMIRLTIYRFSLTRSQKKMPIKCSFALKRIISVIHCGIYSHLTVVSFKIKRFELNFFFGNFQLAQTNSLQRCCGWLQMPKAFIYFLFFFLLYIWAIFESHPNSPGSFFCADYFCLPNKSHFNFNHGHSAFMLHKNFWQCFKSFFEIYSCQRRIVYFFVYADEIDIKIINWNCSYNEHLTFICEIKELISKMLVALCGLQ